MNADKNITLVVGARPNFMKAAPLLRALQARNIAAVRLVHTGQHFDENMSQVFFDQLQLPEPDAHLGVSGGHPANQIAQIISALAEQFLAHPPSLVVVFGDVNSTLAGAIAANKMNLSLAHVEAGLRSFDRRMPEEHNRIVTDLLADYLFTPSADADENLLKEGVSKTRIFRVGNIMVDSLLTYKDRARELETYRELGHEKNKYALVTLHRPSNVDNVAVLAEIFAALSEIGEVLPVVFPVHPRTRAKIAGIDSKWKKDRIKLVEPVSYLEFLNLMMQARVVLTDSGGIQEETSVLGVSCLTLRENTERPITLTISQGTNRLVGNRREGIISAFNKVVSEPAPKPANIDLWDGKTAERIADQIQGVAK